VEDLEGIEKDVARRRHGERERKRRRGDIGSPRVFVLPPLLFSPSPLLLFSLPVLFIVPPFPRNDNAYIVWGVMAIVRILGDRWKCATQERLK
jgi:hypothetical protein